MNNCVRSLLPSEVPPELLEYYDFGSQTLRTFPEGGRCCIKVTCPICGKQRWQRVSCIHNGNSPRCPESCARIRLLLPEDVSPEYVSYYNFKKQKVINGNLRIQITCPDCKKEYWARCYHIRRGKNRTPYCSSCAAARTGRQRSTGRRIDTRGYVVLAPWALAPSDCALVQSMLNARGWIKEHRLVMARHLGRPLQSTEHVHHRNSNKTDNRLANLRLITRQAHHTAPADAIAKLVTEIEAAARRLQQAHIDPNPELRTFLDKLDKLQPSLFILS